MIIADGDVHDLMLPLLVKRRRKLLFILVVVSGCIYYTICSLWWSVSLTTSDHHPPAAAATTTTRATTFTDYYYLVQGQRSRFNNTPPKTYLNTTSQSSSLRLPPCRILLENKVDFHYEVIESTALRYPLPWKELGCDPNHTTSGSPILVDIALAPSYAIQERWSGKMGWERYFSTQLQGKIRIRPVDQYRIQFGNLIGLENIVHHRQKKQQQQQQTIVGMSPPPPSYHAVIGCTCDSGYKSFKNWIKQQSTSTPRAFCVMHLACHNNETLSKEEDWLRVTTKYKCGPRLLKHMCGLSPMYHYYQSQTQKNYHKNRDNNTVLDDGGGEKTSSTSIFSSFPSSHCYFVPIDLPQFINNNKGIANTTTTITTTSSVMTTKQPNRDRIANSSVVELCVVGDNKNHELLAQALLQHQQAKHFTTTTKPVYLSIFGRLENLPEPYYRLFSTNATQNKSTTTTTTTTAAGNSTTTTTIAISSLSGSSSSSSLVGIDLIQQNDYLNFHFQVSQSCHILLPLIDPQNNPSYFDPVYKKATGTIPLAIAYRIPLVIHQALWEIYKDNLPLTVPGVEVYVNDGDDDNNGNIPSFEEALQRSIKGIVL